MRRSLVLIVGAGALLLTACGSSGSSKASSSSASTSASNSGAAPSCSAKSALKDGKLVVTVNVPGPAVAYANDTHAAPDTGTIVIAKGKSSGVITLNDSQMNYVKVTIYANRKSSTCSAIPA